jgi:hypothetical protein
MYGGLQQHLQNELKSIEEAGLYKRERIISSPQDAVITLSDGSEVLNFCANNYLGLSSHPRVLSAAKKAIDTHGFGMSSVRFICGTQDIHKTLEQKIATFLGTEDTILYAAAFDANGGVFEPLFGEEDAIIIGRREYPALFSTGNVTAHRHVSGGFEANDTRISDLRYYRVERQDASGRADLAAASPEDAMNRARERNPTWANSPLRAELL